MDNKQVPDGWRHLLMEEATYKTFVANGGQNMIVDFQEYLHRVEMHNAVVHFRRLCPSTEFLSPVPLRCPSRASSMWPELHNRQQ